MTERDSSEDGMMEHPDLDEALGSDEHGPMFKVPDVEQEKEEEDDDGS